MSLPPGSCSTCHSGAQCAGVRSCHCGMDMCGNLSLVSQHMCGWPCSGYYCCLGAIDSNPLSLLVWTLIMLPPIASRLSFTRNDLHNWCSTFWICWNWRCISLTARIKLPPGGPGEASQCKPSSETQNKGALAGTGLCRATQIILWHEILVHMFYNLTDGHKGCWKTHAHIHMMSSVHRTQGKTHLFTLAVELINNN